MNWFKSILKAFGGVVDAAVPVATGNRTKIAIVACPILQVGSHFVPTEYQPIVGLVQTLLCGAAPAFALAGLARNL